MNTMGAAASGLGRMFRTFRRGLSSVRVRPSKAGKLSKIIPDASVADAEPAIRYRVTVCQCTNKQTNEQMADSRCSEPASPSARRSTESKSSRVQAAEDDDHLSEHAALNPDDVSYLFLDDFDEELAERVW